MKKYFIISLFLGIFSSYAQQKKVGIGIDAPTRTLDINGELRVRGLKEYKIEDKEKLGLRYLTADKKGNIEAYGNGLDYVALGATKASDVDRLSDIYAEQIEYIDLTGMKVKVTIPKDKRIVLIVSYSLPIGAFFQRQYSTYFGVQFYREENGKEELLSDMTRKFTPSRSESSWDMISITNQYVERFPPGPERTVTFHLKGFVDNIGNSIIEKKIRFNMFNPPPENGSYSGYKNYNWGHAYMTYETLELKAK